VLSPSQPGVDMPDGHPQRPSTGLMQLHFAGLNPNKTRWSPEQIAQRRQQDALAKKARHTLPQALQLWHPLPAHRASVSYGHWQSLCNALQGSQTLGNTPYLREAMETNLAQGEPDAAFSRFESRFLSALAEQKDLFWGSEVKFEEKFLIHYLPKISPTFLKETLLNRWAKQYLTSSSPEGHRILALCLEASQSLKDDSARIDLLKRVLESNFPSSGLNTGTVQKGFCLGLSAVQDPVVKKKLAQQALHRLQRSYAHPYGLLPWLEQVSISESPQSVPPPPSSWRDGHAALKANDLLPLFSPDSTRQERQQAVENIRKVMGNALYAPLTEALNACISEPDSAIRQERLIRENALVGLDLTPTDWLSVFSATVPDALKRTWIDRQFQSKGKGYSEGWLATLSALSLSDPQDQLDEMEALLDLGGTAERLCRVLKDLSGHDALKSSVLEQYLFDANRQTGLSLAELLYSPFDDETCKAQWIEDVCTAKDMPVVVQRAAALAAGTLRNPKLRESLLRSLEEAKLQKYIADGLQTVRYADTLSALAPEEGKYEYSTLLKEALQPYLNDGFDPVELPGLLAVMAHTGQDAGDIVSILLPGYQEVEEHGLTYPQFFSRAGESVPHPEHIRHYFQQNGAALLKALALMGPGPIKYAINQKRFFSLMEIIPKVAEHPEICQILYQQRRNKMDVYDQIKLLELAHGFIETDDIDLFTSLTRGKGIPDLQPVAQAYLKRFFQNHGLNVAKMDPERVAQWDLRYIHTLAIALRTFKAEDATALVDICQAGIEGSYTQYLEDPNTKVGQTNKTTRKQFETAFSDQGISLDMETWLNYDGRHRFTRSSRTQLAAETHQNLNRAFSSLVYGIPHPDNPVVLIMKANGFTLHGTTLAYLNEEKQLDPISLEGVLDLDRLIRAITEHPALQRKPVPGMEKAFKSLLSLQRHLPIALQGATNNETESLECGLWKREPGKDLFQGSYTGACTALDGDNSLASVQALQNTFLQIAHLRNVETGLLVGKALFYWAKDLKTGDPMLILNTFEGRDGGYENSRGIRDGLAAFAQDYAWSVAGRDVAVYAGGTELNPLYRGERTAVKKQVQPIGAAVGGSYYLDSIRSGEWVEVGQPYDEVSLWPLYLPEGQELLSEA